MTLDLDDNEMRALLRLLDSTLPDLLWEVSRTEERDYRKSMAEEEHVLVRLRDQLRAALGLAAPPPAP